MNEKHYEQAIIKFLENKKRPVTRPRKLARQMGVSEEDYGAFRAAHKKLQEDGRLMLGSASLTPGSAPEIFEGHFVLNPKGFGFIVPREPHERGDLFVPPDQTGGAQGGDLVRARVVKRGKRGGQMAYAGEIFEIVTRGVTALVGILEETEGAWFVIPDGRKTSTPVVLRDILPEHKKVGSKVVVDIVWFPPGEGFPEGVVNRMLGPAGTPSAEIQSAIFNHNLRGEFPPEALAFAKSAAATLDAEPSGDRVDLRDETIVTIDPATARDYDDAISLKPLANGQVELGIHIADVSYFVTDRSPLDDEAFARGTSVYFPGHVVPMLPPILSNGVCSLSEGVDRFAMSAFISYDHDGEILGTRFCRSIIRSAKRLTYEVAQGVIDGETGTVSDKVRDLLVSMNRLAQVIETRRRKQGMLHLELPEVELILDKDGRVEDAKPSDTSYTHKIIEMFMVEANDAVARLFHEKKVPIIRRIHPRPNDDAIEQLRTFVGACGRALVPNPSNEDLQRLIDEVSGLPEAHAINYALLRTFERATYSPEEVGHFALASGHYAHFTSPIRRYPDLTVHRALAAHLAGLKSPDPEMEMDRLKKLADHCSATERNAKAAEMGLRLTLVLQRIAREEDISFDGIVTGITEFGIFVQWPKYMVEGLVRLPDLGDDWWDVSASAGKIVGRASGKMIRIGDPLTVEVSHVDPQKGQLDLVPAEKLTLMKRDRMSPPPQDAPKDRPKTPQRNAPRKASTLPKDRGKGPKKPPSGRRQRKPSK